MRLLDRIRQPDVESLRGQVVALSESWATESSKSPIDFKSFAEAGLKNNGALFAVMLVRMAMFSEARFAFRDGTGELLTTHPELDRLNRPWPGGTGPGLLRRMIQDLDLGGQPYIYRPEPGRLQRLRPDWVEVLKLEGHRVGYRYTAPGREPVLILAEEMAHWIDIPDPMEPHLGMSWVSAVAAEITADSQMTTHRNKFFTKAATPNMAVKYKRLLDAETRDRLKQEFAALYAGAGNAYGTLILDSDAEIEVVGQNFRQMDFKTVQGAGETRIANAGGVPPVIVGFSEGLQAATYSNYLHAMRRFADLTMRPLWRGGMLALDNIVKAPAGSTLWYDDTQIEALQQDKKDEAEIKQTNANTAAALIRVGYKPESIPSYIASGDPKVLEHSGNVPVTLYPEGQDPRNQGRPPDDD